MIEAIFFVMGTLFGLLIVPLARKQPKEPVTLPQGMKRETLDAQIRQVWNQPTKKEEGAVIMPERADVNNKDLKIDDLLQ